MYLVNEAHEGFQLPHGCCHLTHAIWSSHSGGWLISHQCLGESLLELVHSLGEGIFGLLGGQLEIVHGHDLLLGQRIKLRREDLEKVRDI